MRGCPGDTLTCAFIATIWFYWFSKKTSLMTQELIRALKNYMDGYKLYYITKVLSDH